MRLKHLPVPTLLICVFLFTGKLSAQPVTVDVYPAIKKQEMKSIGGNYAQANYTDHAWDAIGEATLEEFRPSHVRVALPMKLRGKDYAEYKGDKYVQQPLVIKVFETLKRMKDEYGVSNFTISVWNVADALVENPDESSQRVIKPEAYDEVIGMIVYFLVKARDEYGVEADYFSFNESDGGWMVIFSPEATKVFLGKLSKKLKEAGLKTKFLWADTAQTKGTVEFATQIMADTSLWDNLGPLCFHSWWSENISDSEFERIAALGHAWERPVWCSELGFDAMAHRTKGMNKTWDYGMRFAKISYRMMKYAEVEVSLYWTWQNNYAIMSADLKEKYPSYYVTKHHVEFLNNGTQIVKSLSSDPEVLPITGVLPNGDRMLHIINLHDTPVEVALNGVAGEKIKQVSTTEENLWEMVEEKSLNTSGGIMLDLKPESVNSFVIR